MRPVTMYSGHYRTHGSASKANNTRRGGDAHTHTNKKKNLDSDEGKKKKEEDGIVGARGPLSLEIDSCFLPWLSGNVSLGRPGDRPSV